MSLTERLNELDQEHQQMRIAYLLFQLGELENIEDQDLIKLESIINKMKQKKKEPIKRTAAIERPSIVEEPLDKKIKRTSVNEAKKKK